MSIRGKQNSGRGWGLWKAVGGKSRRINRPRFTLDRLEERCLLAVTTTQGLPVVATEGAAFSGVVAKFTSDDTSPTLSSFSANIVWGDGNTTTNADIVSDPNLTGVFDVLGNNTYAEEGTYPVTVSIHDAPPMPPNTPTSDAVAASNATVADAALSSTGLPTPPVLPEGTQFSGVVASFSDADPAGTATDYTAVINWGDGTITSGVVAPGTPGIFTVSGAHTFEEGSYPVSVNIRDAGGSVTTAVTTFMITDPDPVVAPVGPATLTQTEGQPFTAIVGAFTDPNLKGTVSDFSTTIHWGDGSSSTGVVAQEAGATFTVTGTHTYAEESAAATPYAVTFDVKDIGGASLTGAAGVSVTVNDAPIVANGINLVAIEGSSLSIPAGTVVATFTDADPAGTASDYTVNIDWGDGTHSAGTVVPIAGTPGSFSVTAAAGKTFTEEGNFNVRTTIDDAGGSTATAGGSAVVTDAPLTAAGTPQGGTTITEGSPVTLQVASFTDADPAGTATDYTATISWGDGTTSSGVIATNGLNGFNVTGTHTYAEESATTSLYAVNVLIKDVGGATASASTTLTVGDATLTAAASPAQSGTEGKPLTAPVGQFTDADPLGTVSDFSATIHWGDTTSSAGTITQLSNGTFVVNGTHTYTEESPPAVPYAVTYDIKDVGGSTLTGATGSLITIADAPLTAAGSSIVGTEGTPLTAGLLVATFTDSNPAATVADFTTGGGSITLDWGDGTPVVTLPASSIVAVGKPDGVVFTALGGPHKYVEEGSYKITVTATDAGGAVAIASSEADIADAPPVASATQPVVKGTEGVPLVNQAVASFTENSGTPNEALGDYTATIDWGDGSPRDTGTITQPGGPGTAFIVSGTHTYADSGVNGGTGSFPITVTVLEDGGTSLTIANAAAVADVPLVLTGQLNPASDSGKFNNDGVTNVSGPNFFGTIEPFADVTLYATPTGGGPAKQIGQGQADSSGNWSITSNHLADNSYTITATAVDQFGKATTTAPVPIQTAANNGPLVIDTVGARVTGLTFDRLTGTLVFTFLDDRSGMLTQSLNDAANYVFNNQRARPLGKYIVTSITTTGNPSGAGPQNVTIIINHGRLLRGFFQITALSKSPEKPSGIQDLAGNALDGEFYGAGSASGNGVPGGNFVANLNDFHHFVFPPFTVIGFPHPNDPAGHFRPRSTSRAHGHHKP
jgi:hypothetical protein